MIQPVLEYGDIIWGDRFNNVLMDRPQYREKTVGSPSSAMWCPMFMQIYAVYWLRQASSAFSLAR